MGAKNIIYGKLEHFIKKYYANELIKGSILFIGLGLLYFIFTLLVEYFLWLSPFWRGLWFWLFVGVEMVLLFRFILFPVFKLFNLKKGIDYHQASAIIGNHFPEVSDKLTNFIQLSSEAKQSELLLASIEQKADNLQPVPFSNAVNFKHNLKYLPYAAFPVLLFLVFALSGNSGIFTQSLNRVVNYKQHFVPPAPFEFFIINQSLTAQQGNDFILQVKTLGSVIPENASIIIGNENYYLETSSPGNFHYRFEKPVKNTEFYFSANNVVSVPYILNVVSVPTIADFEMILKFPAHIGKSQETVKGTGNAIVPEGTQITWKVNAMATNDIQWNSNNQIIPFNKGGNIFQLSKYIYNTTDYQLFTSNENIKNYEKLQYSIAVIKDQYPTINVGSAPDSLKLKNNMLLGQVADDYGLTKLQLVYYKSDSPAEVKKLNIPLKDKTFDQFVYTFPQGAAIQEGISYEYYFEVFDNDAVNNFKSTKSSVFSHRELTADEKQEQVLQEQNSNINSLEKSIKNQDKQLSELDKLQKIGKEKTNLDFKDQKKLQDFINRQKQQDEMMKEFSKKLEENLEQFNPDKKDEFKEELMKRLEKNEKEIEKNQKLLDELKNLTDKLQKEELFDKVERFKQNAKNQSKNLEQLVELTKRFYVEKKAEQLSKKLEQLGDKQEKLSDSKENSKDKQNDINKEFDKLKEELRDLEKDNRDLKKPMDIPSDREEEKSIQEDMKQASDELQKDNKEKAKPKQKSAGSKMKKMGASMMDMMSGGEMEQMEEDIKMLRQILDNLLAYSFSQEEVMQSFRKAGTRSASFNSYLKKQQDLKLQFKHIDDSLFAMSLRNPKITEEVTTQVGNVHYNIDKALTVLADNEVSKGAASQQYAITAANKLADFLSDLLNNMQMQMSGSGAGMPKPGGKGGEGQLQDIIKKQEGLSEKMKKGLEKGKQEGSGKDGEKGEGGSGGEGEAGELLEIYKEQQRLREALQKALEKEGLGGSGNNAVKQMNDIEKQLLNKGFNNVTMQKMQNLKHELLKLEKAAMQQGEENKRQSQTNKNELYNNTGQLPPAVKEYLNSIEILNRQALPLRPNFKQKVQNYFRKDD